MNEDRSRLFGPDRLMDLDRFDSWFEDVRPMWSPDERPPDSQAWRVRQVMSNHMKESHKDVLEQRYFLDHSISEIAHNNRCSERAVYGMLTRATKAFVKAWADHALDYKDVAPNDR